MLARASLTADDAELCPKQVVNESGFSGSREDNEEPDA